MPSGAHAVERTADQGVKTIAVGSGRALHHGGARLLGVGNGEHVLPGLQGHRAVNPRHTAFERAPELAACDHLLTGVAALFEIYATHAFVVEHLRHKQLEQGRSQQGDAAEHFAPSPGFSAGLIAQRYRLASRAQQ